MTMKKTSLEEVYNFIKNIWYHVEGYSVTLDGVWFKEGDLLSFFISDIKAIKEGIEYTLIAKSIVESGGYSSAGTEVYMASTPLKSGNLLIEVKILDPYIDQSGWVSHSTEEFAFLC